MTEEEKREMLEDAMILISADLACEVFSLRETTNQLSYVELVKKHANDFIEQLDWQGHYDDRDWLWELDDYETKVFDKIKQTGL